MPRNATPLAFGNPVQYLDGMAGEASTTTREMPEPRVVATMLSAEEMREALRQRFAEIGLSRAEADRFAQLPDGYCGKLFAEPPIKHLSVEALLYLAAAAGCKLALIEDPQALDYIAKRAKKRDAAKDHAHVSMGTRSARKLVRLRLEKVTPERRTEIARAAAVIRWSAVKAAVREEKRASAA